MFLAEGRKWWELTPVSEQVFIFDPIFKEFYDYAKAARLKKDDPVGYHRYEARFPHRHLATRIVGELNKGEILWFPPGWVHQVWTYEAGFGVGGAIHNHYVLSDTIYSHLFNRSFSIEDTTVNVKAMLLTMKCKLRNRVNETSGGDEGGTIDEGAKDGVKYTREQSKTILQAIEEGLETICAWEKEFEEEAGEQEVAMEEIESKDACQGDEMPKEEGASTGSTSSTGENGGRKGKYGNYLSSSQPVKPPKMSKVTKMTKMI